VPLFYSYDRNPEVFTPESHLQGHFFSFDLKEEEGAVCVLQVVKKIKDRYKKIVRQVGWMVGVPIRMTINFL
jgi:hypothetical protein